MISLPWDGMITSFVALLLNVDSLPIFSRAQRVVVALSLPFRNEDASTAVIGTYPKTTLANIDLLQKEKQHRSDAKND
jgi:hypothetical protein